MVKRRDIILAKVFFSDLPEDKVRPAIVLSNEKYNSKGFLLVASITTALDEHCIPVSEKDSNCQLDKNSSARFDGVIKLHDKQVLKGIGRVSSEFHKNLIEKIISTIK